MSKKFRRFYETAFDSNISKSDEDLLSAEKQDAAIAHRLSHQLQLSASASSVSQCGGGGDGGSRDCTSAASRRRRLPSCKKRLFGFLLQRKRNSGGGSDASSGDGGGCPRIVYDTGSNAKTSCSRRSTDSVAMTGSSLSLESITSDSLSSHSSESPCYKRFTVAGQPHVLSPISDKSWQDAVTATTAVTATIPVVATTTTVTVATAVKARPPQSLGLIKLNGDRKQQQHHGSDSGISVGSKPGDSYQELLDVPFDMPKLRRKQTIVAATVEIPPEPQQQQQQQPSERTPIGGFDVPKLRRPDAALPFDMPKLRRRQMESCARVVNGSASSSEFGFDFGGNLTGTTGDVGRAIDSRAERKPNRTGLFLNVMPVGQCAGTAGANNGRPSLPLTVQIKSSYFCVPV